MFCIDSRLVTLYKVGEAHFRLLGASDFHIKAENEKKIAAKSVPHVQHDFFYQQARLFFIIQPIKSLGFGGGVALLKDGEGYRSG